MLPMLWHRNVVLPMSDIITRMRCAVGEIGYCEDSGGRPEQIASSCDDYIRSAHTLTGVPYAELADIYARRLGEAGYTATQSWNAAVRAGSEKLRAPSTEVVWRRVLERDLGLIPISVGRPQPTYGEAWHKYGDCIAVQRRYYSALIDGCLHDIWDRRQYDYPAGVAGSASGIAGWYKAAKIWVRP